MSAGTETMKLWMDCFSYLKRFRLGEKKLDKAAANVCELPMADG